MSVARRGVTELQKSSWLSVHFLKSQWQSSFLRHRAQRRFGVQGFKQQPQHSPPPTNNTTTTTNINTHQQNNSSRRRSVGYVARQRQPRRSGHPCRHLLRPICSVSHNTVRSFMGGGASTSSGKYVGQLLRGTVRHGRGSCAMSDGSYYEGDW